MRGLRDVRRILFHIWFVFCYNSFRATHKCIRQARIVGEQGRRVEDLGRMLGALDKGSCRDDVDCCIAYLGVL